MRIGFPAEPRVRFFSLGIIYKTIPKTAFPRHTPSFPRPHPAPFVIPAEAGIQRTPSPRPRRKQASGTGIPACTGVTRRNCLRECLLSPSQNKQFLFNKYRLDLPSIAVRSESNTTALGCGLGLKGGPDIFTLGPARVVPTLKYLDGAVPSAGSVLHGDDRLAEPRITPHVHGIGTKHLARRPSPGFRFRLARRY